MKIPPIIYEDDNIYVIDKPSGLSCQGGAKIENSLDVLMSKARGKKVFLVHRLDAQTSGLVIVAKSAVVATLYGAKLSQNKIKKTYTAICTTSDIKKVKQSGTINFAIFAKGQQLSATTHYKVLLSKQVTLCDGQTQDVCKVEVTIDTGRMHQIRIHLAKISLPIIADRLHGAFTLNRLYKKTFDIKNLQLCCTSLYLKDEDLLLSIAEGQRHLFPFEQF